MSTLLIRLAGPMQAWGASSRFTRRETRREPTKSGVLGLLAAARGMRRTDELEELAQLSFGVRVDQPGSLIRDFQVARSLDGRQSMPLSYRYYLGDAVFVAAVEGDTGLVEGLAESLEHPTFPLYLGRRSCPPSLPLLLEVTDQPLHSALVEYPWQAAEWYRQKQSPRVRLRIVMDGDDSGHEELVRDHPLSFDPRHRRYAWRSVTESYSDVENPESRATVHDPMSAFGGA